MATEKLSEQEIQFRKRARRRLVGAVALVLLMVTVLPMILDDREAQAPQPEIAVNIPSQQGGDFSSKIVPENVPAAPAAGAVNESPTKSVEAAPMTPAPEKPVAQPEPPKVEPVKPAAPAPAKPEAPVAPAKPEPAAAKPVPAKQAAAEGNFTVQIGVFSDAANVKQLQGKLSDEGYKSYTEQVDTPKGPKIRLRVGSYATRAEAEKARDKLKAAGTAGIVVAK